MAAFTELVRRFPASEYSRDARLKIELALDHLAGKEMEIGRYYLNRHDYIAAINRFRIVVEKYQTTTHTPEALERLTEAYLALGITSEARKSASVLGHNFPNSECVRGFLFSVRVVSRPPPMSRNPGTKSGDSVFKAYPRSLPSMLTRLSIRNVILIDKLDLEFSAGLAVLTGETGAGKSILLDSLGLALGHRAEARMLRKGADQAVVSAVFDVAAGHPSRALLSENGIDADDDLLILRRVLGSDGRTKAFINDQPVGVGLLKQLGEYLVEIHGQFETQRLLDPAGQHRALLDAFAGHDADLDDVAGKYQAFRDMQEALEAAEEKARKALQNEAFLRHAVDELQALAPAPGEESTLAEKRRLLQHGEQISAAIQATEQLISGEGGAEDKLAKAVHEIERASGKAGGRLDETLTTLMRALSDVADAGGFLERATADLDMDPQALEAAEERLFAPVPYRASS